MFSHLALIRVEHLGELPEAEAHQRSLCCWRLAGVRGAIAGASALLYFGRPGTGWLLRCCRRLPCSPACAGRLVPLVPVGLLFLRVHPEVLLDVLLDGDPAVVDVYAGAEDVDFLKDATILLEQRHGLSRFGRAEEDASARNQGHHAVRGLLTCVLCRRKKLDLPHSSFCVTSQIRSREAGRREPHRSHSFLG